MLLRGHKVWDKFTFQNKSWSHLVELLGGTGNRVCFSSDNCLYHGPQSLPTAQPPHHHLTGQPVFLTLSSPVLSPVPGAFWNRNFPMKGLIQLVQGARELRANICSWLKLSGSYEPFACWAPVEARRTFDHSLSRLWLARLNHFFHPSARYYSRCQE